MEAAQETIEGLGAAQGIAISVMVVSAIILLVMGPVVTELLVNKKNKDLKRHVKGKVPPLASVPPKEAQSPRAVQESPPANKKNKKKKKRAV